MNTFITFNPHIENHSHKELYNHFKRILQKYYRKTLGQRYYKHKDKQFPICFTIEDGSRDFKQPHIHIIANVPPMLRKGFYAFLQQGLQTLYPHLTSDCQTINTGKYDLLNVYNYCLKEDGAIFTQTDLMQRLQPVIDK